MFKIIVCGIFLLVTIWAKQHHAKKVQKNIAKFPDNFLFGTATSAYQIEGAWNQDGKSESIWDHVIHNNSSFVGDHSNGDIACDHYHKYSEDIKLLKNLGVQYYRFSISWARILPNGTNDYVNPAGVNFYNHIINTLLKYDIKPFVTLYHWDLPQKLQNEGGFLNEKIQEWFANYSRVCFEEFGDRVQTWFTFNEPIHICNSRISIPVDTHWYQPASNKPKDIEAAKRLLIFNYDIWVTPVIEGDFPELVKKVVSENSKQEGLKTSRLPEFTKEQKSLLKGSLDFLSTNYYTTYLCTPPNASSSKIASYENDISVKKYQPNNWYPTNGTEWVKIVPWGLKNLLKYIKDRYNNPEILITENGYPHDLSVKDDDRVFYHRAHLDAILESINLGSNIIGYTAWTLMDNFEWKFGYTYKFGLINVDFNSTSKTRTPKYSYYIYKTIIETKKVDWSYKAKWPVKI